MNKTICYITVKTPFSLDEAFVLTEMLAMHSISQDMIVIPRDIKHVKYHKKAVPLHEKVIRIPWINIAIVRVFIAYVLRQPFNFLRVIKEAVFAARNCQATLRNLVILPKSVYLASILKKHEIAHIHAHWSTTTATMAHIISAITKIPWSFTAHRRDIDQKNLLLKKCESASFVRCIDENGRNNLAQLSNDAELLKKIKIIHMGVDIVTIDQKLPVPKSPYTLLCPASFVPKKGHAYLIDACRIMADRGIDFRCLLAGGGGELEGKLKQQVQNLKLTNNVIFLGKMPHEVLFDLYKSGQVGCVVLPSITADDGDREGIPVALMEAMAHGIPCISTNTGGIAELLGEGSGLLVEERSPVAIAEGIMKLISDSDYAAKLGKTGKKKVEKEFNVQIIARELRNLFYMKTS